jgi:rhamnogalacturonyl hydrolase YesR
MVPPFLAYYAVSSKDIAYAKESVQQCGLYYEILKHESECWKHIIDAPGTSSQSIKQDPGLWSTSNGWAAAGMSRVLATLRKSSFATETWEEQDSLVQMTKGIIDGAMSLDTDPSGLLRNRLNDESWFGECAGTTLLAATVFRMAVLEPGVFEEKYTDWAQAKMRVAIRCIDAETGVIAPVVNPTRDEQRLPLEGVSPEAQAFVGLMMAGWRDWESTVIGDRGDAVG